MSCQAFPIYVINTLFIIFMNTDDTDQPVRSHRLVCAVNVQTCIIIQERLRRSSASSNLDTVAAQFG